MEIIFLILVGLALATSSKNIFSIILFLVIQGISSLFILVFFLNSNWDLLWFAIAIKMGIFPFNIWFLRVIPELESLIILVITTFQKIPPILFICQVPGLNLHLLIWALTVNLLVSGILALWHSQLVKILILGSIANNSWLILGGITSIKIMMTYLATYRIRFIPLLLERQLWGKDMILLWNLLLITGLPPFPIFYLKLLIIYMLGTMSYMPIISLFLVRVLPLIPAQLGFIAHRLGNTARSPLDIGPLR